MAIPVRTLRIKCLKGREKTSQEIHKLQKQQQEQQKYIHKRQVHICQKKEEKKNSHLICQCESKLFSVRDFLFISSFREITGRIAECSKR